MTSSYQSVWPDDARGGDALIEGPYRYLLRRWWGPRPEYLLWVMLNPSTADGQSDDATLLRCLAFSRREGYDRLLVANLFAFRTSQPEQLRQVADPVGNENDQHIQDAAARASTIIVAWGTRGSLHDRDQTVLTQLARPLWCLGTNRDGSPRHPLYLKSECQLVPYLIQAQVCHLSHE
jgi:hypothetical protein